MVVGESVSFDKILYVDLWDDIAPLSAFIYALVDLLFGRSQWAFFIINILVVFAQCFMLNQMFITYKAYKENTYIPALIYMLTMALFFDFFSLSPVLMSSLFMLMVINVVFHHLVNKAKGEQFLNMGLAMGMAILFYLPSAIYLPLILLSLGLYSNLDLKKVILFSFGLLFPCVIVSIFFFWHGGLMEFLNYYFLSSFNISPQAYVGWLSLLIIGLPTLILLLYSWLVIYGASRFSNQQTNFVLFMMWYLIGSVAIFLLVKDRTPHQLMVFAIPASFYLSHGLTLLRSRFIAEIVFTVFAVSVLLINYGSLKGFFQLSKLVDYEQILVNDHAWDNQVEGKHILVIGNNLDAYRKAELSTPYFNWDLSRSRLEALDSYNNLAEVYQQLVEDPPEVIIDQQQIVPKLFENMPTIAVRYEQKSPGLYVLKL